MLYEFVKDVLFTAFRLSPLLLLAAALGYVPDELPALVALQATAVSGCCVVWFARTVHASWRTGYERAWIAYEKLYPS